MANHTKILLEALRDIAHRADVAVARDQLGVVPVAQLLPWQDDLMHIAGRAGYALAEFDGAIDHPEQESCMANILRSYAVKLKDATYVRYDGAGRIAQDGVAKVSAQIMMEAAAEMDQLNQVKRLAQRVIDCQNDAKAQELWLADLKAALEAL